MGINFYIRGRIIVKSIERWIYESEFLFCLSVGRYIFLFFRWWVSFVGEFGRFFR